MSAAVLPEEVWTARRDRHREVVADLVGPHLQRKAAGVKHPVHDFLFTYYSVKPNQLRRWHPGYGTALAGPSARGSMMAPMRIPASASAKAAS